MERTSQREVTSLETEESDARHRRCSKCQEPFLADDLVTVGRSEDGTRTYSHTSAEDCLKVFIEPTGQESRRCPKCRSILIPYIYGLVGPEVGEAASRGELLIGGCTVSPDNPSWGCSRCSWPSRWRGLSDADVTDPRLGRWGPDLHEGL